MPAPPAAPRLDCATFDVVVLGTGLPHSLLAAALARAGKRVLHADSRCCYGAAWTSLSYTGLTQALTRRSLSYSTADNHNHNNNNIGDGDTGDHGGDTGGHGAALPLSECSWRVAPDAHEALRRCSRRFQLDLRCRMVFARSEAVDALIRSGASRYVEFRACNLCFTMVPPSTTFLPVPTSKQQVFSSSLMAPADKRRLMKLLHLALDDVHSAAPSNAVAAEHAQRMRCDRRPFRDMLHERGLSDNLVDLVLYSLCMAPTKMSLSTSDALARLRMLLRSFGRFSRGAFLYPVYGINELPQAFCRVAAVFGAVYMLRCRGLAFAVRNNTTQVALGDVVDGQEAMQTVTCDEIVADAEHAALLKPICSDERIEATVPLPPLLTRRSRCVCITSVSLEGCFSSAEDSPGLCFAVVPPLALGNAAAVHIVQLDHTTEACPDGYFVVHMACLRVAGAQQDLGSVVDTLLPDSSRMFTAFFCIDERDGDGDGVDVDASFAWARAQFERICPGQEFLEAREPASARDRDAYVSDAFQALVVANESAAVDAGVSGESTKASSASPQ